LRGLRDRLGSFEMPGMPNMPKSIHIPRPININFPSNLSSDWNLKVRISKFSRKWFYGCSQNPSNIDEYQIRNENGRVVITPVQEKKDYENEDGQIVRPMIQNREHSVTPISSISATTDPSEYSNSEGIDFKYLDFCFINFGVEEDFFGCNKDQDFEKPEPEPFCSRKDPRAIFVNFYKTFRFFIKHFDFFIKHFDFL